MAVLAVALLALVVHQSPTAQYSADMTVTQQHTMIRQCSIHLSRTQALLLLRYAVPCAEFFS
jgi:hypothetical protein